MAKKKLEPYEIQKKNGMYFGLNTPGVALLRNKGQYYDENTVVVGSIGHGMSFSQKMAILNHYKNMYNDSNCVVTDPKGELSDKVKK